MKIWYSANISRNKIIPIQVSDDGKCKSTSGRIKTFIIDQMPNSMAFETWGQARDFLVEYWERRIREESARVETFKKYLDMWREEL